MSSDAIVFVLFVLLLLVLIAAAFFVYVYWWQMQRPSPKLEGKLRAPFLDAAVEILRDKHGVPHIFAQSEADLFRAQGWVHAQDRMWQLEQARGSAAVRVLPAVAGDIRGDARASVRA
jgi:penicillin amidase